MFHKLVKRIKFIINIISIRSRSPSAGASPPPASGYRPDGCRVAGVLRRHCASHDELAGDGLVIGDNCALNVDCNWIKTECVKPGCGLWWNGDQLEVAHDELAGNGLVIGDFCALDVDCNWIKTNCIDCQTIRDCITPGASSS